MYTAKAKATISPIDSTKKGIGLVVKTDLFFPIAEALSKTNAFKANALAFTVEKLLGKRHSVQLTFLDMWSSGNSSYKDSLFDSGKLNNIQLTGEYKFFVSKKRKHAGYYIGAFAMYEQLNYTITQSSRPALIPKTSHGSYYAFGEGLINGVQFYLFKHLTLDCLVGIGRTNIEVANGWKQKEGDWLGRIAINVGYKF